MRPTLEHKCLFICQAAAVFVFVVWSLEQDAPVRTKAETFRPNDWNQWFHNSTEVCSNTQSYLHTCRQDSIWQACPGSKQLRYLRQVLKYIHTHTHTRLMALCPGLPRWVGTRKKPIWILLKQETVSGSGISWAICKSAPRSRQITTPAPHHSVFYRPDALLAAQPTASKHWRQWHWTSHPYAMKMKRRWSAGITY